MGEAIARFREVALAIRRKCDERYSQPRCIGVRPEALKKWAIRCRTHLLAHEKAGMTDPAIYIRGLCSFRNELERTLWFGFPKGDPYYHWLPDLALLHGPSDSAFRDAARAAVREAVEWGPFFSEVEARIKAVKDTAKLLIQCTAQGSDKKRWAAAQYYSSIGETDPADSNYIARHEEFAEALEALAPFIEEPPAPAATSEKKTSTAKQQKRRDRKGVGGRPERYTLKFIREVFTARERDEKHAAKARHPLPTFSRWLSDYCSGKGINIAEMFPPAFKGEPWQARADRFKKAAKKRLREAETNRH